MPKEANKHFVVKKINCSSRFEADRIPTSFVHLRTYIYVYKEPYLSFRMDSSCQEKFSQELARPFKTSVLCEMNREEEVALGGGNTELLVLVYCYLCKARLSTS